MLIRFNVKNFLSFSERDDGKTQEFSMIAGNVQGKEEHIYDDGKIKLLKFAAVYGANASGKSNLIKAIDFMKKTILKGLPQGHSDQYCRIKPENREKESYFEIEIMLDGRYYAYGFEVILNSGKYVSEWLVELTPDSKEGSNIFVRDIVKGIYDFGNGFTNKALLEKLKIYADDIRDDDGALLLSVMNQNKKNLYREYEEAAVLKAVFEWIEEDLEVNYPDMPMSNYSYIIDTENIGELGRIIAAFGTGITAFNMVDVPAEKVIGRLPKETKEDILSRLEKLGSDMRSGGQSSKEHRVVLMNKAIREFFILDINENDEIGCKTIHFSHGESSALFNLGEESDGTVRILDLIEILISGNQKTYIIDELDRCLHPSLSYKFIEAFLQLAKERNVQLIVTTHESRLMDFDLLRRDEIWFVNKKSSGESDIYSLEEYNDRFDQRIDKAYLEGRYGGVPVFSTVFPIDEPSF